MKKVYTHTIGGRIRAVRTDKGMTIVDLAKAVNVTSHYLSTVELCRKIPSDALIKRIAEALDVSREYIKNGRDITSDAKAPVDESKNYDTDLMPYSAYNDDKDTLLTIAATFTPGGVLSGDELEKLKSMQPTDIMSLLEHKMDASAAIKDYLKIYDILQCISQAQKLSNVLYEFIRSKFGACRFTAPDAEEPKTFVCDNGEPFTVTVRTIQLNPQGLMWRFQYLYVDSVTKEQAKAILEQEQRGDERLSLLFTDEQLWHNFIRYAEDVFPDDGGLEPFSVTSLILIDVIDKMRWEIRSENEMFLDIETLRGIPMADLLEED